MAWLGGDMTKRNDYTVESWNEECSDEKVNSDNARYLINTIYEDELIVENYAEQISQWNKIL